MKPLLLSLLCIAPLCAQGIDVATFGAKPDGTTDNTAAFQKAFAYAKAHQGTELDFPCGANGHFYVVRSPVTFPGYTTIKGTHEMNCQIYYNPTGGAPAAAFSLVGSKFTKIQDLTLMSASSSNVPATILMLGGPHGSSGMHTFTNVAVAGYASRAMVYSIASELNEWRNVYFNFMGGNATIGFYTSAKDDFGICSACEDTSNLSILMDHPSFTVAQSILNHVFTAIEDKTEGGTGDHYFLNGYIGLGTNTQSTGFKFISGDSAHGGFNWKVSVHNFRIENGGHGIQFVKDYQAKVYNYDIEDVTWDSSVNGAGDFMWGDVGLQLYNMRFAQNTGYTWYNNPRGSSTVDGIINSVVMENYGPIHVRAKSLGTTYIMSGLGKVTLPSGTPSSNNSVTQPSVVAPY